MRLFHVSEENDISIFNPRIPEREDLNKSIGLVWAINEACLPNFLTPRNCPRVTYHLGSNTTKEDRVKYFSSSSISHVVIIENKWFEIIRNTSLYLYEFNSDDFELQDEVAGYYVAKTPQIPKSKYVLKDLFSELFSRNIEVRIVDNLWDIGEEIKKTSLNWSICRMRYAKPRQ
ncbi:MAG: hypothetical protein RR891_07020 [Clostridium sp.]|uniref:DUF6886 family protein n=1 Tax=Clostridium sp. TaxID=1506 RepID=UPI003050DCDC